MRVIVEETNSESKNKRRTVIECEQDNAPIHEAMDMLLRALLGCGYPRDAVAYYFNELGKQYAESTEQPAEEDIPSKSTLLEEQKGDEESSE